MKRSDYIITCNEKIADRTFRMRLAGDTSAIRGAGQFAGLAVEGRFLRRPLAVCEKDDESFCVIYKIVGGGTDALSCLPPGGIIDALTGLGNGFDASLCSRSALLVAGGLGASPLFSLAKELRARGKSVTVVLGFNKADEIILEDEYRALGADVQIATMDGSRGRKGLVTDVIGALNLYYDCFFTCGPKVMMKAVCSMMEVPGQVSLEERMGCGCGICYGCTCKTAGGPKRICADGPVFDSREVIW